MRSTLSLLAVLHDMMGDCRWDLVKRAPKELVDHLLERAQNAAIDDSAVHEQYKQAKNWERWVLILVACLCVTIAA